MKFYIKKINCLYSCVLQELAESNEKRVVWPSKNLSHDHGVNNMDTTHELRDEKRVGVVVDDGSCLLDSISLSCRIMYVQYWRNQTMEGILGHDSADESRGLGYDPEISTIETTHNDGKMIAR